jgi:hypothetical protein
VPHDAPARPRSTLSVLGAAVTSGLAGYVVLVLAARGLEPAVNAQFLVFWGTVFGFFGVLIGVTTETTRTVFASRGATGATRVFPVVLGAGAVLVAVVAASGWVWAPLLFGDPWPGLLAPVVVGIALFLVHATVAGAAAGTGQWNSYGLLVGLESVARLVAVGVAVALGAHVVGLAWAVVGACGTWLLLWLASPRQRALWHVRADVTPGGLVRRLAAAATASGVSALLLVGYPVLLKLTTPEDVFAGAAPIILAVSLCRAPLMVPLGAYQNVVVTRVATHGVRALVPVSAGLGVLTVVGSLAAWPIGPWALRVVNPAYHVDGPVFAGLVLGAGLIALLTVTGAAAVALDHHTVYLVGWICATLAAIAVLLTPWSLEIRVVVSLLVGPVVGVAVHLALGRQRIG